jgi:hypothetical protein
VSSIADCHLCSSQRSFAPSPSPPVSVALWWLRIKDSTGIRCGHRHAFLLAWRFSWNKCSFAKACVLRTWDTMLSPAFLALCDYAETCTDLTHLVACVLPAWPHCVACARSMLFLIRPAIDAELPRMSSE